MDDAQMCEKLCDTVVECAQLHGDVSEALKICSNFDTDLRAGESVSEAARDMFSLLDNMAYEVLSMGDEFAFLEVCRAGRTVLEIATALDDTTTLH